MEAKQNEANEKLIYFVFSSKYILNHWVDNKMAIHNLFGSSFLSITKPFVHLVYLTLCNVRVVNEDHLHEIC